MSAQGHWDTVYRTKAPDAVSWYAPRLEKSLELIRRCAPPGQAAVIDVGGGMSTLAGDLLADGYTDITVLDISQAAVDAAKARLAGASVSWIVADITAAPLPVHRYDVWHDRAVFHFLTRPEDRAAYVQQVESAVKPGGGVIVATFGPEGPEKCSGLDVVHYSPAELQREFGARFDLLESATESHRTPAGATQQFVYCLFRLG